MLYCIDLLVLDPNILRDSILESESLAFEDGNDSIRMLRK